MKNITRDYLDKKVSINNDEINKFKFCDYNQNLKFKPKIKKNENDKIKLNFKDLNINFSSNKKDRFVYKILTPKKLREITIKDETTNNNKLKTSDLYLNYNSTNFNNSQIYENKKSFNDFNANSLRIIDSDNDDSSISDYYIDKTNLSKSKINVINEEGKIGKSSFTKNKDNKAIVDKGNIFEENEDENRNKIKFTELFPKINYKNKPIVKNLYTNKMKNLMNDVKEFHKSNEIELSKNESFISKPKEKKLTFNEDIDMNFNNEHSIIRKETILKKASIKLSFISKGTSENLDLTKIKSNEDDTMDEIKKPRALKRLSSTLKGVLYKHISINSNKNTSLLSDQTNKTNDNESKNQNQNNKLDTIDEIKDRAIINKKLIEKSNVNIQMLTNKLNISNIDRVKLYEHHRRNIKLDYVAENLREEKDFLHYKKKRVHKYRPNLSKEESEYIQDYSNKINSFHLVSNPFFNFKVNKVRDEIDSIYGTLNLMKKDRDVILRNSYKEFERDIKSKINFLKNKNDENENDLYIIDFNKYKSSHIDQNGFYTGKD